MKTMTIDALQQENDSLRRRLEEAEETIRAIRAGEVDAVLVGTGIEQVYTLETADKPYRLLIERMVHGAATLTVDGTILYCNRRFAELLRRPLESLLGKSIQDLVAPESSRYLDSLLWDGQSAEVQGEVILHLAGGETASVFLGVSSLEEGARGLCLIVSDLTEQRHFHDLQRTQEALRESEERYRATIEHAAVGVCNFTSAGGFVYANRKYCEILGYTLDELLQKTWQEITPAEDLAADLANSNRVLVGEVPDDSSPKRFIRKDGSIVWVERSLSFIRDIDGQVRLGIGVVVDITERRAAEAALLESQRREESRAKILETVLRATPTPIWITYDRECRHVIGNTASYNLLRTPEGSIVSATASGNLPSTRAFQEYRGNEKFPPHELPLQVAASQGVEVHGAELKLVFHDGLVRHIYGNAVPLWNDAGQVYGAIAAFMEITERKQAEEAVAADLADMTRLQETSTRIIHEGDVNALYHHILAAASAIMGTGMSSIQALEPGGKALILLGSLGLDPATAEAFRRVDISLASTSAEALRTGRRAIAADVENCDYIAGETVLQAYRRSGVRAVQTTPLVSRSGRLLGMLSTHWRQPHHPTERELRLLDVLARQAADLMERAETEAALRDADRRKDEFLAMLAHELRNPLAPIRNALYLIRARGQERRTGLRRAFDIIERQVENLVRLVDDLLDVSRIIQGKILLQKERVSLANIVGRAIEASQPIIDSRRHTLEVVLPPEDPIVEADPLRFAQALWNLLNNAAKFTPEGGRIILTVETVERVNRMALEAVIRVKDTGRGIPNEILPEIFNLFIQADRSLDRADGGLGIGLTLVRRLIEMHGGSVQAFSSGHGKGSEFVVRVPMVGVNHTSAPTQKTQVVPSLVTEFPRHIFVVDDNRDSADSLAMVLQLYGHDVRSCYNSGQVLEMAANYHPDAILLDLGLPGMDGFELCRQLRSQFKAKQPLIVALTGYGQESDRRRSEAAGFDAHLVKPVDISMLQDLFRRIVLPDRGNASGPVRVENS